MQSRRAKEAQLDAERAISDKQRELEQTKASNAALIAEAEAKRQQASGLQREAELDATQIAQAKADAAKVRLEAEASADADAIKIRKVAEATAESIERVNQAIQAGGEAYFRYRQIEMIPTIMPGDRRGADRREVHHLLERRGERRARDDRERHHAGDPDRARRADGREGRDAGRRVRGAEGKK